MKERIFKYISIAVVLLIAIAFVAKFGGPAILRAYVEIGMGDCEKLPILCLSPETEITDPPINEGYLAELLKYKFIDMQAHLPTGFSVAKEGVAGIHYRKKQASYGKDKGAIIYLLYEKPDFFISLFPQVKKQGTEDNYEFVARIMYAKTNNINNLTDTFFAIAKTIFTPNLGDQKNIKMVKFTINDKRGFITYNLSALENYFDCNIIDRQGDFFKIYIKDKSAALDLNKVLTIVSTVNRVT